VYGDSLTEAYIGAASSLHPGGANFAMVDGSVRFIKGSIDSWQLDAETATPRRASHSAGEVVLPSQSLTTPSRPAEYSR